MSYRGVEFKEGGAEAADLAQVDWKLMVVLGYFMQFCKVHDMPCVLTNVLKKFSVSTSDTHPDGRAFDARTKDWPRERVDACKRHVELYAGHLGAVTKSGAKKVCVWHDAGLGEHFHFQVHR